MFLSELNCHITTVNPDKKAFSFIDQAFSKLLNISHVNRLCASSIFHKVNMTLTVILTLYVFILPDKYCAVPSKKDKRK